MMRRSVVPNYMNMKKVQNSSSHSNKETRRSVVSDYTKKIQNDITTRMREILVDWLVEVSDEYKLVSDTLYLTVSLLDRFLSSSNSLRKENFQLLGVSCMLVAAKYEKTSHPKVEDFCDITDNTYTKEEVVRMERNLLHCLNFQIVKPTVITFLRLFTSFSQKISLMTSNSFQFELFELLGCYLAELSLLDYDIVGLLPSMVAASVIFVARFTIEPEKHPWSSALEQYSYTPSQLKGCVLAVHNLQLRRETGTAIRKKYSRDKFKCVAALSSPSEIPACYFNNTYWSD